MKFVCMFSGGAASYNAARRIVDQHGTGRVVLLFNDVGMEDESTYRAVREGAKAIGCELHWVYCARETHQPTYDKSDGLTVWGLFNEQKMIGKPGAGLCSRILKRETAKMWVRANAPAATVVIGMTWEERHRMDFPRKDWAPNPVAFPMAEEPWITKQAMIDLMASELGFVPELYKLGGFEHSNCGGACVKAGHARWRRLNEVRPDTFRRWESLEQEFRENTGKDVAILRDRIGGPVKPLTLRKLREEGVTIDLFGDEGTDCGCFTADD